MWLQRQKVRLSSGAHGAEDVVHVESTYEVGPDVEVDPDVQAIFDEYEHQNYVREPWTETWRGGTRNPPVHTCWSQMHHPNTWEPWNDPEPLFQLRNDEAAVRRWWAETCAFWGTDPEWLKTALGGWKSSRALLFAEMVESYGAEQTTIAAALGVNVRRVQECVRLAERILGRKITRRSAAKPVVFELPRDREEELVTAAEARELFAEGLSPIHQELEAINERLAELGLRTFAETVDAFVARTLGDSGGAEREAA